MNPVWESDFYLWTSCLRILEIKFLNFPIFWNSIIWHGHNWTFFALSCFEWTQWVDPKRIVSSSAISISMPVVYFDQQTGAPHAVRWSKSFVSTWKQVISSSSATNRKKRKKKESVKTTQKNMHKSHTYIEWDWLHNSNELMSPVSSRPKYRALMQSSSLRSYFNFYLEKQLQDWTWRSC